MGKVRFDFDKRQMQGCYGLSMEDGTRYTVSDNGTCTIDRPDHLKALQRQGHHFSTNTPQWIASTTEGTVCESCGHHGYKWNTRCPKCLGEMVPYDENKHTVKRYWPR